MFIRPATPQDDGPQGTSDLASRIHAILPSIDGKMPQRESPTEQEYQVQKVFGALTDAARSGFANFTYPPTHAERLALALAAQDEIDQLVHDMHAAIQNLE